MRDGARTSVFGRSGLQDVLHSCSVSEAVIYHVNVTALFKIKQKANWSGFLAGDGGRRRHFASSFTFSCLSVSWQERWNFIFVHSS